MQVPLNDILEIILVLEVGASLWLEVHNLRIGQRNLELFEGFMRSRENWYRSRTPKTKPPEAAPEAVELIRESDAEAGEPAGPA